MENQQEEQKSKRTKCQRVKIPFIKNKWIQKRDGRMMVTLSDGKRITYSRYLMWEKKGFLPQKPEIVHHINGDKTDDRVENLKIVTQSEHRKIHNKGNKYGKKPKTKEHKKKIGIGNTKFKEEYLFEIYNKNNPLSQRKFASLVGAKSHSFIVNRFGSWANFERLAKINDKRTPCRVYTRCVGYFSAKENMNEGKQQEVEDRKMFEIKSSIKDEN